MTAKNKKQEPKRQVVAQNRKAAFSYHLLERFDAGLVLQGSEVKSIRAGKCSIAEAFARIKNGEVWLHGMHIAEYFEATYNNHMPTRTRKLLLHRLEIRKLVRGTEKKGMTIVPGEIWISERGFVKVTIWLAEGKKDWDKRETIRKRDQDREMRSSSFRNAGR